MWEKFSVNNVCRQMPFPFCAHHFSTNNVFKQMAAFWFALYKLRKVLTKHFWENNVCEQTVFWRSQLFHTRAPSFLPRSSFSHILLFHNIEKRVDVATNMKPMQNCFGLKLATVCFVSMFSLSPENTHGNACNSKTTFCHTPEKIQIWKLEQQLNGDGYWKSQNDLNWKLDKGCARWVVAVNFTESCYQ